MKFAGATFPSSEEEREYGPSFTLTMQRATLTAVERGQPGIYNIVDDDPAPVSEWLPGLARAIGAKPPLRIPAWLGRLVIGEHGVVMMTEVRGTSNRKAKGELGWGHAWATWRDGFREGLSDTPTLKHAMGLQKTRPAEESVVGT